MFNIVDISVFDLLLFVWETCFCIKNGCLFALRINNVNVLSTVYSAQSSVSELSSELSSVELSVSCFATFGSGSLISN